MFLGSKLLFFLTVAPKVLWETSSNMNHNHKEHPVHQAAVLFPALVFALFNEKGNRATLSGYVPSCSFFHISSFFFFLHPSLLSILGERLAYFTRLGEQFSQCGCSKPRGDSRQALPVLRWVWAITVHMETPLRQAGRIDRAGFPSLKDHLQADTNPMMQELRLPYRRSEAREAERR